MRRLISLLLRMAQNTSQQSFEDSFLVSHWGVNGKQRLILVVAFNKVRSKFIEIAIALSRLKVVESPLLPSSSQNAAAH
jgi:hypothetical protein